MVRIRAGARKSSCTKGQAAERKGQALKNLIVNADDLGWAEGVNRGIADAFRIDIVTSIRDTRMQR